MRIHRTACESNSSVKRSLSPSRTQPSVFEAQTDWVITRGTGDLPGVTTMNSTDSANVAAAGGSNIVGNPPEVVDTSTVDPNPFLNEYLANADYVYNTPGTYAGQSWGSPSAPVVVYCNAGGDTSFSIKFTGGVTGYGILVVQGNVQFNGGVNFVGLVVVSGFNTVVSFGAAGTPQILGGLIVAGNSGASVTLKGTGTTGKISYSSAAIQQAMNIGKLRYYRILSWYEQHRLVCEQRGDLPVALLLLNR